MKNDGKIAIYAAYNPPDDPGISGFAETLTQQQFRDECDINTIMDRYISTGEVPQFVGAFYDDFTSMASYHEAQNILLDAQDEFLQLPAHIRERFHNDPGKLLDFIHNPENTEEAIRIGLFNKPESSRDSAPLDVTVTTDTNN